MRMAFLVAERSTCSRARVGTVIATPDYRKVVAMGYNGNASGLPNRCDVEGAEAVGRCGCLHSEENAVINCDVPRSTEKVVFCTTMPCPMCAKRLANLGGVRRVHYARAYRSEEALAIFEGVGIEVVPPLPGVFTEQGST